MRLCTNRKPVTCGNRDRCNPRRETKPAHRRRRDDGLPLRPDRTRRDPAIRFRIAGTHCGSASCRTATPFAYFTLLYQRKMPTK
jgi:hypothetical protein